jgi:N-acetylglutamate synthase-like GNAT family acetyltransferase
MEREVVVLSARLKATKAYYAPRIEPEQLEAAIRDGRAAIRRKDGEIEALAVLWPTNDPKCLELGTVWVGEGLRGNGLREELMAELVQRVPPDISLFLITPIEAIMRSAERLGFRAVTTKTHPKLLVWASEVGIVTRLPDSIHPEASDASLS